jgi:predicted Zn-dependent protease
MTLFPRNVAVTVLYGDTLLRSNEPAEAHRVLLDLFNNVPATPMQIRLLAQAASGQGDAPEANYYAAEYLLAVGDLNGDKRPDIVIGNKKGGFVFIQEGTK